MKAAPKFLLALLPLAAASAAQARIEITEWMYTGPSGEFVEFTNLGDSAVDFTGWSYDDDSRTPGVADLSAFGQVVPGQSVLITESAADAFRSAWSLAAGVKVIGGITNNLGRNDEINLFDASGALVDRLTYGDGNFPGTIRTQNVSGTPLTQADLVPQAVTAGWVLSTPGDAFGSYAATGGDIGNPGLFTAPIPEPSTYAMLLAGLALVAGAARRRSR